jgi:hypothetical protein
MPDAISVSQCWALLHRGWFGHLSVSVNALPLVVPVEYCVAGAELALCLGQYALPASALDAVVGFATETLDPATREGWSIQIQGRSHTTERSSAFHVAGMNVVRSRTSHQRPSMANTSTSVQSEPDPRHHPLLDRYRAGHRIACVQRRRDAAVSGTFASGR